MNINKKYATVIQVFSLCAIVFNMVSITFAWFFPHAHQSFYAASGFRINTAKEFDVASFSLGQKISGFIVEGILCALLVYGFILLIQLMGCFKENKYFTHQAIVLLKRITRVAFAYTVSSVICSSLLSVITSLHNVPGKRILAVGFGTPDVLNIIVFCFMFLLMTVFQKGFEYKHEQELTI